MPFVISTGYIRLVRPFVWILYSLHILICSVQRVVVLKDQTNKASHEASAQIACEAAAAIRTVASLTREDDCCNLYSESLMEPMMKSNRTAVFSNLLYSASQAMSFWVISLVFWYGSRLVASGEYDTKRFFICLMVCFIGSCLSLLADVMFVT